MTIWKSLQKLYSDIFNDKKSIRLFIEKFKIVLPFYESDSRRSSGLIL